MKEKKITKEQVQHLAFLAKLSLNDDEIDIFTSQLNDILDYFSKLDEVDVSEITPTSHVVRMKNVFREDVPEPSLDHDEALKNAPKKEDGYIVAPKII